MLQNSSPYRGRIQAQGDDIDQTVPGGYSRGWAQEVPITRDQGIHFLEEIKQECKPKELDRRATSFKKAKRFIENAAQQGGVSPESQPHSFIERKSDIKNARVDIEIASGLTFIPLLNS